MKHKCIFCGYEFDCMDFQCPCDYLLKTNCEHHHGTSEKYLASKKNTGNKN